MDYNSSSNSFQEKNQAYNIAMNNNIDDKTPDQKEKRGFRFWMCIIAVMMSAFVQIFDIAGLSNALPVIIQDLHGEEFEWVGSAYALSATAFQPMSGGLAQVFGRRFTMLLQIFLLAVGSALCGAAPSLNFLIAARTIQGIGAGGISSLTQIIIADLVPLQERGIFNGLVAIAYCFGTASAPLVSGALAEHGQWRWYFYLNLPICAVTAILVATCLKLKVPRGTVKEKLLKLDWIGNFLVIAGTTAIIIALTWGGVKFPWSSWQVLVPLIVGFVTMVVFIVYEAKYPEQPLVPLQVVSNRTSLSGYFQAFFTNFYLLAIMYYIVVYYQACKLDSPLRTGVLGLGLGVAIMPFGMIVGISVAKSGKYRPQLWLAWVSLVIAGGILTTMDVTTSTAATVGFQVVAALGLGILLVITFFPVLAPLPVSLNANALAFFMFLRYFSQVWGVTVGGSILQNKLKSRLPAEFLQKFPSGTSVAYSIIPIIHTLDEPLRSQVQVAFADGVRGVWQLLIGLGAAGLVASLFMKALPLHTSLDRDWGLDEQRQNAAASDSEAVES